MYMVYKEQQIISLGLYQPVILCIYTVIIDYALSIWGNTSGYSLKVQILQNRIGLIMVINEFNYDVSDLTIVK